MHVKTYRAAELAAAMAMVKAELGAEAVILETRSVTENGKALCEITAALDRDAVAPRNGKARRAAGGLGECRAAPAPAGVAGGMPGWPAWQDEWNEIKSCIATLMGSQMDKARLSPRQRHAIEHLERQEVDQGILVKLYAALVADPRASLLSALGSMVAVRPLSPAAWGVRLHAVCGPFGAGKTSTVIRLALAARAEKPDANICLVNADARQARGKLVLRHYADLSGLAYREAAGPEDMDRVLAEAQDFDYLFIDLPGMAGKGALERRMAELGLGAAGAQDDAGGGLACHLVLNPLYGKAQMDSFLATFAWDGLSSVIWTKLDEAAVYGGLVNVAERCGRPVSALAWGPGFRDCMAPAESMLLWKLLFKRELPGTAADAAGEHGGGATARRAQA